MVLAQGASRTSSLHYPASCCSHADELGLHEPYCLAVPRKVFTISYSQKQCVPFDLQTQIQDHSSLLWILKTEFFKLKNCECNSLFCTLI